MKNLVGGQENDGKNLISASKLSCLVVIRFKISKSNAQICDRHPALQYCNPPSS